MFLIRVAAGVLNQTPLAWDNNKANIVGAIQQAGEQRVSVLCLPELCISGYGCEDAFQSSGVQRMALDVLREILPETRGMIVSLGLPLFYGQALFNAVCLAVDGRIVGFTAKRFLAGDGLHYEPRWFKPWPVGQRAGIDIDGETYPLGDIHYQCGGVKIGFEICEDAWVARRPGSDLAARGVDLILNPSASHFAFGKETIRERFVLEGSRAFGVSYLYANLLGNEAGRAIYDGGAMIASTGKMLAIGPRFAYSDYGITTAQIDVDSTRMARAQIASFSPAIEAEVSDAVPAAFSFPEVLPEPMSPQRAAWESGSYVKEEEFARAVALGLFDYLRKSKSRGFVVSLSGGADSAACSCLVNLMVQFALADIGAARFAAKLRHVPELQKFASVSDIVKELLTCVYQATRNSGDVTRNAARGVATAIGAQYLELNVDSVVQDYIRLISDGIGRELSWESDDLALQNIQARARAPSVWLLANLRGALLLSTSNRSEAAVGYATMDGDTAGGLSPIAGIDKAFLRRWLIWLEKHGPEGFASIPALSAVNRQQPTAELRPQSSGQTDEQDLMPYDLLDAIERAAIRDKRTPLEVFLLMQVEFRQYDVQQLHVWVERFFKLWCRNQWKRERYAPSFHVDDENLDPKTWCRFPILSGGFERELNDLRQYVERGQ